MQGNSLLEIYRTIRRSEGAQNWWPGDSSFEVVIGCILTQNTNWGNVEKAISRLKDASALSPERIIDLPLSELTELIKPAGFHSQKPQRLKTISRWWSSYFGSELQPLPLCKETIWGEDVGNFRMQSTPLLPIGLETLRSELLALNGVGPETADSILLYALGFTSFVVDNYTRRIFSRLGIVLDTIGYEPLRQLFMVNLPPDVALFNDYHAQVVRLAINYCRTKPRCAPCPLVLICPAGQSSIVEPTIPQ